MTATELRNKATQLVIATLGTDAGHWSIEAVQRSETFSDGECGESWRLGFAWLDGPCFESVAPTAEEVLEDFEDVGMTVLAGRRERAIAATEIA